MNAPHFVEHGEAIPFSRACLAAAVGESAARVSNWIDRHDLWSTHRGRHFHRSYTIREAFDLAGFALLRAASLPERECARYVRNYGFYRHLLHGDQLAGFGFRDGCWSVGFYDPEAEISIVVNVRTMAGRVFRRISEAVLARPHEWPHGSFESFRLLYREALKRDRLEAGMAPLLERPSA